MKIIMAELLGHEPDDGYNSWKYTQLENVPDVELLTQQTFCLSPNFCLETTRYQ